MDNLLSANYKKGLKYVSAAHTILIKRVAVLSLAFLPVSAVSAQKNDTVALAKKFMAISSFYKQIPLKVSIQLQNKTNFIIDADDTSAINIDFYLQKEGTYIKINGVEQVANDSAIIMVNHSLKQIVIFPNDKSVSAQVNVLTGNILSDSSLINLNKMYEVKQPDSEKEFEFIELNSRKKINKTLLSKESILLKYAIGASQPSAVIQVTRSLIKIENEAYDEFYKNEFYKNNLVAEKDNFYVIREATATYNYNLIEYNKAQLPFTIDHYIVKNAAGNYIPVKAFENYLITVH